MSEEQKLGTPTGHSITHEEFVALEIANLHVTRLKARLWDLERFAENVANQLQQAQAAPSPETQPQVEQLQKQFVDARASHNAITQELNNATQDLNAKIVGIMEPLGLSNQRVLVEETEPHEIRII